MAHARTGARIPGDRLGITDVAAAYGVEAILRRVDRLRADGQWFAAHAIETELRAAGLGTSATGLRPSA
ncbi:hypothetical protein [Nocardia aurantia]|uniref:Uncharacterized protein n=1 Tax=Nocardia aurantia TaxID=2585199 RepID=A0A7K0DGJ4_9NOCA|nr:hypothetical protein [Nocardia aurantia]MQY24808.1 hypothetical protein [Nocardia aurantia]